MSSALRLHLLGAEVRERVRHALGAEQVQAQVRSGHEQATQVLAPRRLRAPRRPCWRRRPSRGEPSESVPAQGFCRRGVSSPQKPCARSAPAHPRSGRQLVGRRRRPLVGTGRPRSLFELATARDLYETQLRSELTGRLGVSWRELQGAWADIAGIDLRLTRAFSRRSAEIEAVLRQSGRTGRNARNIASAATRPREGPR